jgi:hypothetical protein
MRRRGAAGREAGHGAGYEAGHEETLQEKHALETSL